MSEKSRSILRRALDDESGQTLVWVVLLFALLLGMGGLVVDLGRAYISYRELQATTDAAALAAAAQLPISTSNESSNAVSLAATNYSSVSGNYNAFANLNTPIAMTGAAITVTPGCVTVSSAPQCQGGVLANAVQVTQTVTIPTYFIKMLSVLGIQSAKSISLSATSTAQMRGSQRGPYNVALVVDTTASMASSDGGSNCTGSKIQCAEQGAQILLSEFSPCLPGAACGSATNGNVTYPVDEVSLFTFPAQTAGTQVTNDESYNTNTSTNCSGRNPNPGCPSVIPYPDTIALTSTLPLSTANLNTLLSEYQVVPLSSNYRSSDTAATGTTPLTTSSTVSSTSPSIVNAVGGNGYFGGTKETGMMALGGENTFFAGALFTAQQYLAANSRPNAQNVIILLSDGDANGGTMGSSDLNSDGSYPSAIDQCQQAIDIATAAKAAGTEIYVVGYGVAGGGCEVDGTYNRRGQLVQDGLTACSTLAQIASSPQNFFVDTSSVSCPGATSVTMNGKKNSLSAIFSAIVWDLTFPRLLPNNVAETGFTASAL